MSESRAFLYRWTQLSTGMTYHGSRTARGCHPDDGYICSSDTVLPLIQQNPHDWTRDILVIGEPKYIRKLEGKYLRAMDAKNDPMSYNRSNMGGSNNGGRKKGQIQKLHAQQILDAIEKVMSKPFLECVAENYIACVNAGDKKLINSYQKMFDRKGITIKYNGDVIYEPR